MTRRKGGTGRKRIDTTNLIEDPAKRQVAFSKRRPTLFTKARDLSVLCGVDTAVVVFSQGGRAYAFGSPSVDAALRRLDGQDDDGAVVAALRRELDDAKARVEAEKARMKAVEASVQRATATPAMGWWHADVQALGAADLPEFGAALQRFRDTVLRLRINGPQADTLYLNN